MLEWCTPGLDCAERMSDGSNLARLEADGVCRYMDSSTWERLTVEPSGRSVLSIGFTEI